MSRWISVAALLTALVASAPAPAEELRRSGTVSIEQTSVAFLVSGTVGGGHLVYEGRDYPFSIGGLGVGGVGVSTLKAAGEVYNLDRLSDFPGVFGAARTGYSFTDQGRGNLWLENPKGVVLHLRGESAGLALSAGVDGVVISMDE
jgi:hypothetical protein